jgi:small neutral amino acid transporter SnatA (MarC family)
MMGVDLGTTTVNLQATPLLTTPLLAIVNPLSSAVLFVTTASRFSKAAQRKMR